MRRPGDHNEATVTHTGQLDRNGTTIKGTWHVVAVITRGWMGFEPLPPIENNELNGFSVPHDPIDPHRCPGRDTY
jgi:hypothetical protein